MRKGFNSSRIMSFIITTAKKKKGDSSFLYSGPAETNVTGFTDTVQQAIIAT